MAKERLQKLISQAGVASRRKAEEYITQGRVRVNGQVVRELGTKADLETDKVEVEGYGALASAQHVYILLHKPPHVMTTLSDPEGRPTVVDLLFASRARGRRQYEGELPRVYPVGRLDFDAEGALLLTNDGALANQLMHPRHHVPKTYLVKVKGRPEEKQLERMRKGMRLKERDGRLSKRTSPADVRIAKESPHNTWLELVIVEGRHHQVKRMCEAVGHHVIRLIRTEFGGLHVDDIPPGGWRFLTEEEVQSLGRWGE